MTDTCYDTWRPLLNAGLAAAELLDAPLWSIHCGNDGRELYLHLGCEDPDAARKLAYALGVNPAYSIEETTDTTFSVASRGVRPFYYDAPDPYPHAGASVPFADRLVEIHVFCGLPE